MSDFDFPIVLTASGLQPQDPEALLAQLLNAAAIRSPGYTANLPGSLVEDISSTDVAAIALMDAAKVDTVNTLTPSGANEFLLLQLGQLWGVPFGQPTNTSVFIIASGTVGYVIPDGLLVGDGGNTFQVTKGGPIGGGGVSQPLQAVSILPGSFGVPANTVQRVQTSVPTTVNLAVNNPSAGTPGALAESWASYRTRVMQAGLAACVGSARYIKTLVRRALGVQKVSVQSTPTGLRIITVGGDAYEVAYAIFRAVADPGRLVGSHVTTARNINVSLIDPPNTFNILYVNSPQQTVTMTVTWNTTLSNFSGGGAFPGLVQAPLVAYINALDPGAPINIFAMEKIFETAVAALLPADFLTRLVFSVSINGTSTPVSSGTGIVVGDDEGYFFTSLDGSGITVLQG
jgi:hypothetical protein